MSSHGKNLPVVQTEFGVIYAYYDGLAKMKGPDQAFFGEILRGVNNQAMVCSIEKDFVVVSFFGKQSTIKPGYRLARTGKPLRAKTGPKVLNKVWNGVTTEVLYPKNTTIQANEFFERKADSRAPGIIPRAGVCEPLRTGIRAVDALIPLGRGQRELIIGDRKIGKTTIAVDTILNQKVNNQYFSFDGYGQKRLFCIYVSIGQKKRSRRSLQSKLEAADVRWYVTFLAAFADDLAPLKYRAPYSGTARGEYFRDNKNHALIIYDDLSKHADAYRQRALLLEASPGREAFPGDIFYTHSRLLERSAKMSKRYGYGSLTALPIIETQGGDVSAYIATNVISITDGQIYLDGELFNRGIKPAVNAGLSVSRVGSKAQTKLMKLASGQLKGDISQYRERELFSKFGSDLDVTVKKALHHGKLCSLSRVQNHTNVVSAERQTRYLYLLTNYKLDKFLDGNDVQKFSNFLNHRLLQKRYYRIYRSFFVMQSNYNPKIRDYFNSCWDAWKISEHFKAQG